MKNELEVEYVKQLIIHSYAKANNKKRVKYYDESKESLYLNYWNVNNLYGWAMSQKLPVNNFEWIEETSQFNKDFIKNYNEESDEGYFLEADDHYPEKLHELHNCSPFLSERMELGKIKKLVTNLHDKTEYVIHVRTLKQADWLKPYIKMNTELRQQAKNHLIW